MKNKKINDILNDILIVFLLIQPLFDIYMSIVKESFDIFGISIITYIRILVTVILTLYIASIQLREKYKLKCLYYLIGYIFIVFVYAILHHFNIVNSNGYYIKEGIYSFFTEFMYVFRLTIPVMLLYDCIILKPNKEKIEKGILISVVVISVVILGTNILKLSLASYSPEGKLINYNLFDWFKDDEIPYREALSKGLFVSANQISVLLLLLLPITMYYAVKKNKLSYYVIILIQIISMMLVGTRVASLGWIAIFVLCIIAYGFLLFFKFEKKQGSIWLLSILTIFVVGATIYNFSPSKNRVYSYYYDDLEEAEIVIDEEQETTLNEFKEILKDKEKIKAYLGSSTDNLEYDAKCKYIIENFRFNFITKKYIYKIYPYNEDPDFWLELFSKPAAIKGDNRKREIEIIKRIKDNNDNFVLDTTFGMGATPMNRRELMIENDIISHYYNLGIIGLILFIFPYMLAIIVMILKSKNGKNLMNMHFISYLTSAFITYLIALYAGHAIDEYIVSIYFALIVGVIYNFNEEEKNSET